MDIRIVKTKNCIINAFLDLRAKKAIEKITVKELCEKAMVNKSTFYAHYKDIYDLSESLENQIAEEIIKRLEHPEFILSDPQRFNRDLFHAYLSQEHLIQTVFSGSRVSELLAEIESNVRKIVFELYPEYKDDAAANVILTYNIYGGFYAFRKCRKFGDQEVIDIMGNLNERTASFYKP